MSKDYGVTKRFEDLENRPQGGGRLPENYLYNTSFEVVSGNTINPRLEWWKGEYGYNTSEPYGGRRSVEIESNDGYIETSMERVWLSSVGADIESRYTGEMSTEPLEGSKWDYQETILSFYYKGQGVNVVVSTDDTQVARESAPYAESWTRFHMRIPALESHNEFKIRVDNSGLNSGIITMLDCFQLERVTESGEPSTYVPGKYSTTDLGLATRELERTAERITDLERETWKPKFNMIYNSSFLKRDMYGDANFWTIYYPYRNRTYPAYTDTGFDLETYRSSISEYDHIVSEMPHFMFLRVFCQLKPTVEEGKGGFYLPESPDRAYYHFSFYAVARLGEATDQVDPTLRAHLISLDNPDKEPVVLGDVVVSRSRDKGEWNKETANPSVRHLKAVADKNSHYWNKYDLVFRVEDSTLSTTERMGIMLSDETEEYGAVWLLSKLMLQVLDGGDFSYLGHDYVEGGGLIIEPVLAEDSRIGNLSELGTEDKSTIVKAINEVFNDVDEGKRSIASALTDKQQPATGDETFIDLSNKIRAIKTEATTNPGSGSSAINMLSERSKPISSVIGTPSYEYEDGGDLFVPPLIVFTDDINSFEVAVLASDLRWEMRNSNNRLGVTIPKTPVMMQHVSTMPSVTTPHKPVLALVGKTFGTDNSIKNFIESLGIQIPVFDMSFAPESGCLRNLLLGVSTAVSIPKEGSTISPTIIPDDSTLFPMLRGYNFELPIYAFDDKTRYFPIMAKEKYRGEAYVERTASSVAYRDRTILTDSSDPWSTSPYVEVSNSDWITTTLDGYSCVTNKDIGDSQVSRAYLNFEGVADTTLSFKYTVSSERNYDFFKVYYNGYQILYDSGSVPWKVFQTQITSTGPARITFEYSKDSSVSAGSDAVFLREIKFKSKETVVVDPNAYTEYCHSYITTVGSTSLGVYCAWVSSTMSYRGYPMGRYDQSNGRSDDIVSNDFIWSLLLWGDDVK